MSYDSLAIDTLQSYGYNVILYSELGRPIEQYFQIYSNGCPYVIILVLWNNSFGHYVCVFERKKKLTYFDSFGSKNYFGSDNSKIHINIDKNLAKTLGQDQPLLFKSFVSSKYNTLYFNDYQLQKIDETNCGQWAILRIEQYLLTDLEFYKKYKKFKAFIYL